jgi:phosphate/sulfate permease
MPNRPTFASLAWTFATLTAATIIAPRVGGYASAIGAAHANNYWKGRAERAEARIKELEEGKEDKKSKD